MDLAAESFAGEPVGELMDGADDNHEDPGDQEPLQAEVVDEAAADFCGVGRDRRRGDGDEREGEGEEGGAEERLERRHHPGQEPVGIEHLEAQVEQVSLEPRTGAARAPAAVGLEQAVIL